MSGLPSETTRRLSLKISYLIDDLLCDPSVSTRQRAALLRLRVQLAGPSAQRRQAISRPARGVPAVQR